MTTPLLRVLFDSARLRVSTAGQGIAGSGVEAKLRSTVGYTSQQDGPSPCQRV